jgi:four helix bundle protein
MRTSNIQHRTPNIEVRKRPAFDLEERLLDYAAEIIRMVERLPVSRSSNHVAGQVLRSGTAPLPNHGEAEAAESHADFIHKLKICLKELRETLRWIKLIRRVPLNNSPQLESLQQETDELIRIFVTSIRTSEAKNQSQSRRS